MPVGSEMIHADRTGPHLAPVAVPEWARRVDVSSLTFREREVLLALGECRTNSQIASRLVITERTVRKHIESIFGKLSIASRSHAAIVALVRCPEIEEAPSCTEQGASPEDVAG
ncbi:response regulator transcription factor [Isoptericola jiangsuensis]|uniref:response regulator transcription factor n=1 Tax=Isoptericola jiangsuensis TaxID=548579 RepID=UPI003AB04733